MKQLMILRHAKASRDDLLLNDHDRPLKVRGMLNAIRMGQLVAEKGLLPDLILSSTAFRAKHTAELVAQHSHYQGTIEFRRQLYHAAPGTYIQSLRSMALHADRCLVVGHNPGMHDLVAMLNRGAEHFPTAALALFQVDIASWLEFSEASPCTLIDIFRVKELNEPRIAIARP